MAWRALEPLCGSAAFAHELNATTSGVVQGSEAQTQKDKSAWPGLRCGMVYGPAAQGLLLHGYDGIGVLRKRLVQHRAQGLATKIRVEKCGDVTAHCRDGILRAHGAGLHRTFRQPDQIGGRHVLGALEIHDHSGPAEIVPQASLAVAPLLVPRCQDEHRRLRWRGQSVWPAIDKDARSEACILQNAAE